MGEGHITWDGHRTWYRVAGDLDAADKLPLVALHGGPGAPSYYLTSLAELADTPDAPSSCTTSSAADAATASPTRRPTSGRSTSSSASSTSSSTPSASPDGYHLYGQSWGGMLALEHAFTHPSGLKSLVLANTLASTALWVSEAKRLVAELPDESRDASSATRQPARPTSDEYTEAMLVFYGRHLCRIDPFPDDLMQTFMALHGGQPRLRVDVGAVGVHLHRLPRHVGRHRRA